MSAKRGGPIDVIEAAYDTDGTDRQWLAGLANAARSSLGRGGPTVAFLYDLGRAKVVSDDELRRLPIADMLNVDGSAVPLERPFLRFPVTVEATDSRADLVRFFEGLHEFVPAAAVRVYQTAFVCRSAVENMGGVAHPAFLAAAPAGVGDFIATAGVLATGEGVHLSAPTPERARLSRAARSTWARVAVHLAAGLRLRRGLGARARESGDDGAVLDGGGRVHHAEGAAKDGRAREALRRAVIASDRARGKLRHADPDEAVDLWRGLVAGRWSLVDRFESDGRRFVVARSNAPGYVDPRALTGRERDVVASAARGRSISLIAYELGITPSTVGVHLARAMKKLGVRNRGELAGLVAALDAPRRRRAR